jgi:hypothetical protein
MPFWKHGDTEKQKIDEAQLKAYIRDDMRKLAQIPYNYQIRVHFRNIKVFNGITYECHPNEYVSINVFDTKRQYDERYECVKEATAKDIIERVAKAGGW